MACRSLLKLEAEVYYYESIVVIMQNASDIFYLRLKFLCCVYTFEKPTFS